MLHHHYLYFFVHERFGREDNTLVMVSNTGTINVRILKRTAQFECLEVSSAPQIGRFFDKISLAAKFCFCGIIKIF